MRYTLLYDPPCKSKPKFIFDLLNISFWIMLSITSNIKLYSIEEEEMIKIFIGGLLEFPGTSRVL